MAPTRQTPQQLAPHINPARRGVVDVDDFEEFVLDAEPRLRRAFAGIREYHNAKDAVATALAWAWENWTDVITMENPVGYLYRVGQSATRTPKDLSNVLPDPRHMGLPEIEPGLIPALIALPERQRVAVWLVHGCEWTHPEVADALGIKPSTVATHVERGLQAIRRSLAVENPQGEQGSERVNEPTARFRND